MEVTVAPGVLGGPDVLINISSLCGVPTESEKEAKIWGGKYTDVKARDVGFIHHVLL